MSAYEVIERPEGLRIQTGDGEWSHVSPNRVVRHIGTSGSRVCTIYIGPESIPGHDPMRTYIKAASWNGELLNVRKVYRHEGAVSPMRIVTVEDNY